ncbi:hypothetical protein DBV39_10335 [Orrella marina]|uniref:Uncharacterized protein n=1 Tax=Orrella marina TaxID=2163011 RepID=A0A2R4XJQ6_9BURK|nr:hypothetical protein DBV39_10335 [Orrella marina]
MPIGLEITPPKTRAVLIIKTAFTLTDPENRRNLKGYPCTLPRTKELCQTGHPGASGKNQKLFLPELTILRFQSELRNLADFLFLIKLLDRAQHTVL